MYAKSTVELIDYMGDDRRAAEAARVSLLNDDATQYMPQDLSEKDKRLISFLMKERHTSPFEHSVLSFRIYAPLPVVAQIMRHRTFSYNQASRRYTSEDIEFFDMGTWRKQGAKNLQCSDGDLDAQMNETLSFMYKSHCLRSLGMYESMIELGASREQARFVLPQSCMARFWMTGNLHNFLKFLLLRDDEHAQPECQEVARLIKEKMEELFPETMQLFESIVRKK